MMQSWEPHKWIFEPDGSLLDIYVQESSIEEWLKLIDFLNANYTLRYGPVDNEESDKIINGDYVGKLLTQSNVDVRSASIYSGNLNFNCHFFLQDEIEFDIAPEEINGQADFEALIEFMTSISNLLNKEVILTAEGAPDKPLIKVEDRINQLTIITQQELKELYKRSITVSGRIKGYYVSSLMQLLPKLKSSSLKSWLADYIVKLTGANRPHKATKRRIVEH